MTTNLEAAKASLSDELEKKPYVKENPYGNAGSRRKIENYIIESVKAKITKDECLDILEDLLKKNALSVEMIGNLKEIAEAQYTILERFVHSNK